jgi:hypothetical protein
MELFEFHDKLHELFQRCLMRLFGGVPLHDQVRFVLHSPQLDYTISLPFMPDQVRFALHSPQMEYPISLPFMPRQRLITVLAKFERVIYTV